MLFFKEQKHIGVETKSVCNQGSPHFSVRQFIYYVLKIEHFETIPKILEVILIFPVP